jgi:mannose/fructose/N-acetylgalactosamine-specific phosphotransferase system component IIC
MIREALIAGAVGGLLWLDRFQIFQAMISRPIVCAPIVGWAVGDLQAGLASGLLFEMLWLRRPPVGGYVPPDGAMAAMATAAVSSLVRAKTAAALMSVVFLSFLCLYPVAFLGKRVDLLLRTILGALARAAEDALAHHGEQGLYFYFVLALLVGFLTAFAVLVPLIVFAALVLSELVPHVSAALMRALGFGYYAVPLLGTADLVAGLNERRYIILFVIGFVVALGGGLILGF